MGRLGELTTFTNERAIFILSKRVKELRKKKKMSVADLVISSKLQTKQIQNIERKRLAITLSIVSSLCVGLSVTLNEFLDVYYFPDRDKSAVKERINSYRGEGEELWLVLVGLRMNDLRKGLGISLREMAARTGIDDSKMSKIEKGYINITLLNFYHICRGLNTTPHDFFNF